MSETREKKHLIYKEDLLGEVLNHFGIDIAYLGEDLQFCQEAIDMAPTVDAVEVVHGRWIFKHDPITDPKKYFIRIVCSNCNLHTGQRSNYCPQCGARMDGGNEDGK